MNNLKKMLYNILSSKTKIIMVLIILLALILRLFKFSDMMSLNADYGMAYLIADRIIKEKFALLVGPTTAFGEMVNVNPPVYYYLITFLYWILKSDIAVSLVFAFVGVFTVYFIFLLGREIDSTRTGLFASLLYATSFMMITYDRNIWEPYRLPFFIVLSLYFMFLSQRKKSIILLLLSSVFYVLSLMYITSLLLLPSFFFFYILYFNRLRPKSGTVLAIFQFFIFLSLLYLPVFIYESQHYYPTINFINKHRSQFFQLYPRNVLNSLLIHLKLFLESIYQSNYYYYYLILFLFLLLIYFRKSIQKLITGNIKISIIIVMFLSAFLLTGIYNSGNELYAWRLAPLYPLFFILFAYIIAYLQRKSNQYTKQENTYLYLLIVLVVIRYLMANFFMFDPEYIRINKRRYDNFFKVAEYIIESSGSGNYSIYVITADNIYSNHSIPYYYAILKLSGKNIANYSDSGNWIIVSPDVTEGWLYLICSNNILSLPISDSACFERFKKISRIKRNSYVEKKHISNDTVYRINAAEN